MNVNWGSTQSAILIGADQCRGGWVVARSDPSLETVRVVVVDSISPVIDVIERGDAIACLDVPIGLSPVEPRRCDLEARRFLGSPRSSSVFPPPCRAALSARSYEEASRLNQEATGRKISLQSYGIIPAIREVDEVMEPALQARIREFHPEVTFAVLSGRGRGLEERKKSRAGVEERRALLRNVLPEVDHGSIRSEYGSRVVGIDDILDALAGLVTAFRITNGEAQVFPEGEPETDDRGLRMEIVA
ncbi:MAG: DUF429 domain-containing protein [Chloroflexota bacterium]